MSLDLKRQRLGNSLTQPLTFRECVIGDREFYRKALYVALPMIIQNTLTSVVSLLDNVMIGQVGTLPMSAVAIVNQLFFVFYLCTWGAIAGAGIYSTQFFGKGDYDGMRQTFRIKLIIAATILCVALILFYINGDQLVGLYIARDTSPEVKAETLKYARSYMRIMLAGLAAFSVTQVYTGTYREAGKTTLPMIASITAMTVNFVFNALLIFGLFGFPKMGVTGAAVATVLSRYVEVLIVVVYAHLHTDQHPYFQKLYSSFGISAELAKQVAIRSFPLLINETLWSTGQAWLLQCYSVRGLNVIAAMNINQTISMVFSEVFLSLGNASGVLTGQELGAGRLTEAKRTAWRMVSFSVISCLILAIPLAMTSPIIPQIYKTEPEIRHLAMELIIVTAIIMPINGFANASYFIMRSGGKTLITMVFDSGMLIAISLPVAYCLAHFTNLPVQEVYFAVCALDLLKVIVGFILIRKGVWIRNLVSEDQA